MGFSYEIDFFYRTPVADRARFINSLSKFIHPDDLDGLKRGALSEPWDENWTSNRRLFLAVPPDCSTRKLLPSQSEDELFEIHGGQEYLCPQVNVFQLVGPKYTTFSIWSKFKRETWLSNFRGTFDFCNSALRANEALFCLAGSKILPFEKPFDDAAFRSFCKDRVIRSDTASDEARAEFVLGRYF